MNSGEARRIWRWQRASGEANHGQMLVCSLKDEPKGGLRTMVQASFANQALEAGPNFFKKAFVLLCLLPAQLKLANHVREVLSNVGQPVFTSQLYGRVGLVAKSRG